jgi:hypothetical protein
MASKVQFELYHGEGMVEYGVNRKFLRGFKCIENWIDKSVEWIFRSVYQWLERDFYINSETTILTVHAVVNQA